MADELNLNGSGQTGRHPGQFKPTLKNETITGVLTEQKSASMEKKNWIKAVFLKLKFCIHGEEEMKEHTNRTSQQPDKIKGGRKAIRVESRRKRTNYPELT